jgi:acetolactate synthase-1/2/3 large subunit
VFIEFCLDIQAVESHAAKHIEITDSATEKPKVDIKILAAELQDRISASERPVFLLGGGVSRELAPAFIETIEKFEIPIMTTWNGADRVPSDHSLYFGRPNTWGQRSSNIILQQSDLLIAVGTRLGLQQTGFNWQKFLPNGKVIQVDIDKAELTKSHPAIDFPVHADSSDFLDALAFTEIPPVSKFREWVNFAREIRQLCPLNESVNSGFPDSVNPYEFVSVLSKFAPGNAVVIPCSSGGAFTTMMQAFEQKENQLLVTNKGLASMGYGLAGAIGAAEANKNKPIILVEGDGGFAQNLQELGTAVSTGLALKIFLYSNEGYASIRMTQRNYFDGAYMGCDVSTGLGLPNWEHISYAYGFSFNVLSLDHMASEEFFIELNDEVCRLYLVPIDPEQTYFPKISSSVGENGQMLSDPLHLMTPPLPDAISKRVFRYI